MGQRYRAILKHLDEAFDCADIKTQRAPKPLHDYERFIVATPTNTHSKIVNEIGPLRRPILCEKPLSKDLKEVLNMISVAPRLSMMMQYRKLISAEVGGLSWYDYFRHGQDGLVWDCAQIIMLGTDDIVLREQSPIWNCGINGQQLSLSNMDDAYVRAVDDWLNGEKLPDLDLFRWHKKVKEYEEKLCLRKSQ